MAPDGRTRFLSADSSFTEAQAVIFGIPFDRTSTYRKGAALGPAAIRKASDVLESYSPILDRDLADLALHDSGDVRMPSKYTPGATVVSIDSLTRHVTRIIQAAKIPVALGGNHTITVPIVKQFTSRNAGLAVVCFDAHLDLRAEYEGDADSHACAARRILENVGAGSLFIVGARSGTRDEFSEARHHDMIRPFTPEAVAGIAAETGGRPVYISFDMDVFDPSIAPGVTTPEPGGAAFADFSAVLGEMKKLHIVGFDVVETCPPADPSGVTAIAAAKVVREFTLCIRQ